MHGQEQNDESGFHMSPPTGSRRTVGFFLAAPLEGTVYSVHCTLFSEQCTVEYSAQFLVFSAQCYFAWVSEGEGEHKCLVAGGGTCVIYCTALSCPALTCIALYCNVLKFSALQCPVLYCHVVLFTALQCTTLPCNEIHCTRFWPWG